MSEKLSEAQLNAFLECDRLKPCRTCLNDGVCCELVVSMTRELIAYRQALPDDAETVRALDFAKRDLQHIFELTSESAGGPWTKDIHNCAEAALSRLSSAKGEPTCTGCKYEDDPAEDICDDCSRDYFDRFEPITPSGKE